MLFILFFRWITIKKKLENDKFFVFLVLYYFLSLNVWINFAGLLHPSCIDVIWTYFKCNFVHSNYTFEAIKKTIFELFGCIKKQIWCFIGFEWFPCLRWIHYFPCNIRSADSNLDHHWVMKLYQIRPPAYWNEITIFSINKCFSYQALVNLWYKPGSGDRSVQTFWTKDEL